MAGFEVIIEDHLVNVPRYTSLPTLSVRLAGVINCNPRHAGQIEYLRACLSSKAGFRRRRSAVENDSRQRTDNFSSIDEINVGTSYMSENYLVVLDW